MTPLHFFYDPSFAYVPLKKIKLHKSMEHNQADDKI